MIVTQINGRAPGHFSKRTSNILPEIQDEIQGEIQGKFNYQNIKNLLTLRGEHATIFLSGSERP